jgi:lactoylglutathione lyase
MSGSAEGPAGLRGAVDSSAGLSGAAADPAGLRATADSSPELSGASLRIELFPDDLDGFVDFYTRVLGFDLVRDERDSPHPYAAVALGSVQIGAVRAWAAVDPATRNLPGGVEIVIEVDDLAAAHRRVVDGGWPLAEDLVERPWGLTDFRVLDPAGYFLRITDRPNN